MAQTLLVTPNDLKRYSSIAGNLDPDKMAPFIKIAQDIQGQQYLGTDLLARLEAGVQAADLTATETALLNNYVKDMLIHWAIVEMLSDLSVTVSNQGIYKHSPENAETLSKEEVDSLVQRYRSRAQSYTQRFVDYICQNSSDFSEYSSNVFPDVSPTTNVNYQGWDL